MNRWNALAVVGLMACGGPMTGGTGGGSTATGGGSAAAGGGTGGSTGGGIASTGGGTASTGGGTASTGGGAASTGGGAASTGGGSGGSTGGGTAAGRFFNFLGFIEPVPVSANESCDLEVDHNGRLHVVTNHTGVVDGGLDYSVRETDGGWTTERIVTAISSQPVGSGVKIELDANDKPHVAFVWADVPGNGNRTRLFYATKPATAWQTQSMEDAGFQISTFFAFKLDSTDKPHLAYRIRNAANPDGGAGLYYVVRYATPAAGGGWSLQEVDTQVGSGEFAVSMAVDGTNTPHVFYKTTNPPDGGGPVTSALVVHAAKTVTGFDRQSTGSGSLQRSWGTAGSDGTLYFTDDFNIRIKPPGAPWGYVTPGSSTSGNSPVMVTAPNGVAWDFTNSGPSSGGLLNVGRTINGMREGTTDAGIGGVIYSGWDFDSAGHPWGVVNRTDGFFVLRLD